MPGAVARIPGQVCPRGAQLTHPPSRAQVRILSTTGRRNAGGGKPADHARAEYGSPAVCALFLNLLLTLLKSEKKKP